MNNHMSWWNKECHWQIKWLKKNVKSFTSLKADLRQDINGGLHLSGALMENFLEGSAPLRLW